MDIKLFYSAARVEGFKGKDMGQKMCHTTGKTSQRIILARLACRINTIRRNNPPPLVSRPPPNKGRGIFPRVPEMPT